MTIDSSTSRRPPPDLGPRLLLLQPSGSDTSGVHDYLQHEAFQVRRAGTEPGVAALARRCQPDVVVLQADARDDGLELMRQILSEVAVPVIIVAARDSADSVEALDRGADDYIIEPAALPEIAARARAAVRRSKRLPSRRVRQLGALELDGQFGHARTGNRRLLLTPSEYIILEFLSRTPGQVVPREDLVQALKACKPNAATGLGQRVQRLRAKLAAADVHEPSISVVRGVGYRLDTG